MTRPPVTGEPAVTERPAEQPGMWSRQGPYLLDWAAFGTLAEDLAAMVRDEGFAPDAVLALARGGLPTAGCLACALDVTTVHALRVRRTTNDSQYAAKQRPVIDAAGPLPFAPGHRVLVVDDIVGTGATAHAVLDHLTEAGIAPDDVRFAALVRNHRSGYVPDHCAAVIDDWIVFPWEADRGDTPDGRPFPQELRVRGR